MQSKLNTYVNIQKLGILPQLLDMHPFLIDVIGQYAASFASYIIVWGSAHEPLILRMIISDIRGGVRLVNCITMCSKS